MPHVRQHLKRTTLATKLQKYRRLSLKRIYYSFLSLFIFFSLLSTHQCAPCQAMRCIERMRIAARRALSTACNASQPICICICICTYAHVSQRRRARVHSTATCAFDSVADCCRFIAKPMRVKYTCVCVCWLIVLWTVRWSFGSCACAFHVNCATFCFSAFQALCCNSTPPPAADSVS